MIAVFCARVFWWICTGLCLGMALCGFLYADNAYLIGGGFGIWWFSTLCLLPDAVYLKRRKAIHASVAGRDRVRHLVRHPAVGSGGTQDATYHHGDLGSVRSTGDPGISETRMDLTSFPCDDILSV